MFLNSLQKLSIWNSQEFFEPFFYDLFSIPLASHFHKSCSLWTNLQEVLGLEVSLQASFVLYFSPSMALSRLWDTLELTREMFLMEMFRNSTCDLGIKTLVSLNWDRNKQYLVHDKSPEHKASQQKQCHQLMSEWEQANQSDIKQSSCLGSQSLGTYIRNFETYK